ncbi:MAG: DUF2764 family protein [Pontiellaceae bacterium]|nr:DUF2764 family protein [Pontiellaceae bacterium]MBN2784222.1 DUF2764 family protein [Pontiellaceae bacterium]
MAYYSLVASLPYLKIGDEPPFSTEAYVDQCGQWVSEHEKRILEHILLNMHEGHECPVCKKWFDIETQLRNALARLRGHKLGVDFKEFLQPHDGFIGEIEQLAADAFNRPDPVEIEEALDRARWQMAEDLADGKEPFCFEKVLAYGIQLKIVERWNRMDVHTGKEKLEAVITANTEKEETATPE